MTKEKLRKVGLCFITDCFITPVKVIINHFLYISQAHLERNYGIFIPGISKGEIGKADSEEWQIKYFFQKQL